MPTWLLDRLFDHKEQPTPRFAFQGTVNWMRALAILVDTPDFEYSSLSNHFSNVQRRTKNEESDTSAYSDYILALHNVGFLAALKNTNCVGYDMVRAAIISWYYAIYYSSKAMIAAASGGNPQTHAKTARVWQSDIVDNGLAVGPFGLSLKNITSKTVEAEVKKLRAGNPHDLNTLPTDKTSALGAVISYLSGTADYEKWRIEEEIRGSRDFKKLNVTDFRTKAARELRDNALSQAAVNFLVQAFRYRGKANYRDSIYLSYGVDRSDSISVFINDLEMVASKFVRMSGSYVSRRTEKGSWSRFANDLVENARFTLVIDPSEI